MSDSVANVIFLFVFLIVLFVILDPPDFRI